MVTRPQLDPSSDTPLYRQLYAHIRENIEVGALSKGDRLPPTRELAGTLGLNRATVSAAYELLESEGLIQGHVGRGSFVAGPTPGTEGLDWEKALRDVPRSQAAPQPPDDAISFATSRPSERLFPLEEFRATCDEVLSGPEAREVLQLGSPNGYAPLRHYLESEAAREGVARERDGVLITSGCQQALDLIQRVLVRAGDVVAIEDPVYPGLKTVFERSGARLVPLPTGDRGVEIEIVERVLERERPRLIVVTPNFQNPTGATMPLHSRLALLKAARAVGAILVENDIYGALRYEGEPLPLLKQLDEAGDAVLLRSFSKIAFPGLRVGWVVAPRALIAQLAEAKQWCDLHTDQLSQAVLLRFAQSGRLEEHRKRILTAGRERLRAVLDACAKELPPGSRFTHPQGGMNLWVRLPEPLDAGELLARAQREKVSYLPGRYFAVAQPAPPGALRLSFAGLAPEEIRRGLRLLGALFSAELEGSRTGASREPAIAMV